MLSAGPQPRKACSSVWAAPISLAATFGIDVSFFSSGYLDVSVPRVPSFALWIHANATGLPPAGFPHSDLKGSMPACGSPLLFAACHVLLRRLVPLASTLCSCSLDYKFLRLTFQSASLLRLIASIFRSIDFHLLQLVFKDFLMSFLCAVVKVRGGSLRPGFFSEP